ncbi:MAG: N-methylhydantoinase, partial [Frankiales bacterium]|nr:N-methylhydantoinase [Frankiales bacterium]
ALRPDLAREAIERRIAQPLGLDVTAAAGAMLEVITLIMAAGTKDMAFKRGFDPRELLLVSAGGAGPLHAGMIAEELDIERVVIPRMSAVLCAFGMLLADLRHDYVRSYSRPWDQLDPAHAGDLVDRMVATGMAALEQEGIAPADRSAVGSADLRYRGQHHEVSVTFDPASLSAEGLGAIEDAFHRRHEELYGFSSRGRPMDIVSLRATTLGRRPDLRLQPAAAGDPSRLPCRTPRPVYLPSTGTMETVQVYDGDLLVPGHRIVGPAVVEAATTTLFVPERFDVLVDRSGNLIMHRKGLEEHI